jgi:hypothetical protein
VGSGAGRGQAKQAKEKSQNRGGNLAPPFIKWEIHIARGLQAGPAKLPSGSGQFIRSPGSPGEQEGYITV